MYRRNLQSKNQCVVLCLMSVVDCRHSRYCHPAGNGVQDQDGACQAEVESSLLSDMQQCQQPEAALCCSCS